MKLIDVYDKYKSEYKEYVIMIESGVFYNIYNKDCGVFSIIFNYKIKKNGTSFLIGFWIF